MNTLDFLQKILPASGTHYLVLFPAGEKYKLHKAFDSLEEMAEAAARFNANPRYSAVYHACASFNEPFVEVEKNGKQVKKYRISTNWQGAKAFWVDIDCGEAKHAKGQGYLTQREAYQEVCNFSKAIGWKRPMAVSSGYGLHAYWPLEKAIPHDKWVAVANTLKAAAAHYGLLADPTRTADFASILRPVGTVNNKYGENKAVRLIADGDEASPKEMWSSLKAYIKEHDVEPPKATIAAKPAVPGLNDELVGLLDNYPQLENSHEQIAEHCQQIRLVHETKGDCSYDHWRLAIGIAKHCVNGEEVAYDWTSRREETGHEQADVDVKFATWDTGPSTCAALEGANKGGCDGCIHKGKIKSPIVLGRIIPIARAEEVVEAVSAETGEVEQVTVPAFHPAYQWKNGLMVRIIVNKDGVPEPHAFATNLFYPTMRVRKEDGTFNIGMRMHLPDNRTRDFEIPFEAMASTTDLLRGFAKYELIQSNHKDAGTHMHAYLRDSMEKLKREVEEVNTLTTFGWKYDMQAFLIGDRLYHKDGSVRRVLLGGYAAGKKHVFPAPRGTLAGYASPLNFIYNRKGLEPLQYALCAGWGSILAPFCEDAFKGLMFSLYSGQSGTGKSTVCYNSLYAFGTAEEMTMKSEDMGTKNALYARLGAFNNIPMLFDELTKIDPEELSSMAYRVSLGQERDRMRMSGGGVKFAETSMWRMSPFVTSNKDLHALLSMTAANAEAEAVRVVQINLDQHKLPVYTGAELQAFQMACDQIKMNAGAAGDAMIRYVVTNVDKLYERMRNKVVELANHISEPKFRFYRSHAACTIVMAEIAKELGVIEFDVENLQDFAIDLMLDLRDSITISNTITPEDSYNRLLSSLQNRIIVTTEYRDARSASGPESPRRPITGEVAGRYIVPTPHSRDPYKGRLFLVLKDVKDWCTRNRVDLLTLTCYLKSCGALVAENEKVRLTRGTDMSGVQQRCLIIDTLKLESAMDGDSPSLSIISPMRDGNSQVANA